MPEANAADAQHARARAERAGYEVEVWETEPGGFFCALSGQFAPDGFYSTEAEAIEAALDQLGI
jgi:hypothetical protein